MDYQPVSDSYAAYVMADKPKPPLFREIPRDVQVRVGADTIDLLRETPLVQSLPESLLGLSAFVCITESGEYIQPNGDMASQYDPHTWHSIWDCLNHVDLSCNLRLGWVVSTMNNRIDPYTVISIENAYANGSMAKWATEIVLELSNVSYREVHGNTAFFVTRHDMDVFPNVVHYAEGVFGLYSSAFVMPLQGGGRGSIKNGSQVVDWLCADLTAPAMPAVKHTLDLSIRSKDSLLSENVTDNTTFSYVLQAAKSKHIIGTITLAEVVDKIRSSEVLMATTDQYKAALSANDTKAMNDIKILSCPAILPHCRVVRPNAENPNLGPKREGLATGDYVHTNLLHLDIDDHPNFDQLFLDLCQDSRVRLCWRTLSGNVRALIEAIPVDCNGVSLNDPKGQAAAFEALKVDAVQRGYIESFDRDSHSKGDSTVSNVSNLAFLNHDPNAYYDLHGDALDWEYREPQPQPSQQPRRRSERSYLVGYEIPLGHETDITDIVRFMRENGIQDFGPATGKYPGRKVTCSNFRQHSNQEEGDAQLVLIGSTPYFRCWHNHCRDIIDFWDYAMVVAPNWVAARKQYLKSLNPKQNNRQDNSLADFVRGLS